MTGDDPAVMRGGGEPRPREGERQRIVAAHESREGVPRWEKHRHGCLYGVGALFHTTTKETQTAPH